MESIASDAILAIQQSSIAFIKFITANDVGATGGHQKGYHLHLSAWPMFFSSPGEKGSNKDIIITIKWQNDFETHSRITYYGKGTRNEYRLTRFGRGFPFLCDDNIGDLLVLVKRNGNHFSAFVLHQDEDIENILLTFSVSPRESGKLIQRSTRETIANPIEEDFINFIDTLSVDFPSTSILAQVARTIISKRLYSNIEIIKLNPDRLLLEWLDAEFTLFRLLESNRYNKTIRSVFSSVEELIEVANTILNRRKSRAGKSLEHHLGEIFNVLSIRYDTQKYTEGKKRPDFLFPSATAYHNKSFSEKKLTMLAAKTTCKDRWRQVLNEADRIKTKHLFTLQQGISPTQLDEMYRYNVQLVVPRDYLTFFPKKYRSRIMTLEGFTGYVQTIQSRIG